MIQLSFCCLSIRKRSWVGWGWAMKSGPVFVGFQVSPGMFKDRVALG